MHDDMHYSPSLEAVIRAVMEGKQVGKVYHFTNLRLLSLMATQQPPFVMFSRNGLFSMTRNPYLSQPPFSTSFREYDVRIGLDGDKMSDKYQIRPIAGRPDDAPLDPKLLNRPVMNRSKGEAEEYVKVPPDGLPIQPYISAISIIRRPSHDPVMLDTTLSALTKMNIPVAYEKTLR